MPLEERSAVLAAGRHLPDEDIAASRPTSPEPRTSATLTPPSPSATHVMSRSDAERSIRTAVDNARAHGYSWAFIGSLLGTSGEAARQRYGAKQEA